MPCCVPPWHWHGTANARPTSLSRWSTRPSRLPSATPRRARRPASSTRACGGSCVNATSWWASTDTEPVAQWNHPRWWIERLKRDHPREWQRVLGADNAQAPMTLRVNARKSSAASYLLELEAAGLAAVHVGPVGLQLARARPVQQLPGFAEGASSVQDAAAQMAAPLLLDGMLPSRPGAAPLRVLDACAAPGGKTAHLLELAGPDAVEVTALDSRCHPLPPHRRHPRAPRHARPRCWWPTRRSPPTGGTASPSTPSCSTRPCTASGIVRRHPDVRWLRREKRRRAQLAASKSRACWTALWPLLKPGGRLVYCTCSVFPGRRFAGPDPKRFLRTTPTHDCRPAPGHLLPQNGSSAGVAVPDNGHSSDHDGFFYALLEKRTALDAPARQADGAGLACSWLWLAAVDAWLPAPPAGPGQSAGSRHAAAGGARRRRRVLSAPTVQFELPSAGGGRVLRRASRCTSWPRLRESTASAGTGPTARSPARHAPHAPGLPAAHAALAAQGVGSQAMIGNRGPDPRCQNFDTIRRRARRRASASSALADRRQPRPSDPDSTHTFDFRFRLDVSQLPQALSDRRRRPGGMDHLRPCSNQRLVLNHSP
jgi:16S rRNA (cytosine967-C5)-methyltransferase